MIVPDPEQPRKTFKNLPELKSSIEKQGILVPLNIESNYKDNLYLLLDGERRYKCAKELGLTEVPVIITEGPLSFSERTILRFNIQEKHENWSVFDKARSIYELRTKTKMSIAEIAEKINMEAPMVHGWLSIVEFSEENQKTIDEKNVSFTYLIYLVRIVKNCLLYLEYKKEFLEQKLIERVCSGSIKTSKDAHILSQIFQNDNYLEEKKKFVEDETYEYSDFINDTKKKEDIENKGFYKDVLKLEKKLTSLISEKKKLPKDILRILESIQIKLNDLIK